MYFTLYDLEMLDNIIALSIEKYEKIGEYTNVTCKLNVERLREQLYDYNYRNDRCYYGYINYVNMNELKYDEEAYYIDCLSDIV